jgi:hypothetical protein
MPALRLIGVSLAQPLDVATDSPTRLVPLT